MLASTEDRNELWLAKVLRDLAGHVAAARSEHSQELKRQERAQRRLAKTKRELGDVVLGAGASRSTRRKVNYSELKRED